MHSGRSGAPAFPFAEFPFGRRRNAPLVRLLSGAAGNAGGAAEFLKT